MDKILNRGQIKLNRVELYLCTNLLGISFLSFVKFASFKEIVDYWKDEFDWREVGEKLNDFSNYTVNIDGIDIHFIFERGSGDHSISLLIPHGCPGAVYEMLELTPYFILYNLTSTYLIKIWKEKKFMVGLIQKHNKNIGGNFYEKHIKSGIDYYGSYDVSATLTGPITIGGVALPLGTYSFGRTTDTFNLR